MKPLFLIFMLLPVQLLFAQTEDIPENIQSDFEGTWVIYEKYYTNTILIKFDHGRAFMTDIGSGKAPPLTFPATLKGNRLIIPAQQNRNDYLEMEVIHHKLHVRIQHVQWDENGNIRKNTVENVEKKIFQRIRK
ncbi:DUF6705 family protein [Chryseobacterium sp. 22458]|uniref:DUF6705 family protein n=1 Tax=Chryseobacterium sp. 22458 TaxID=3453921 RepID=UPI003F82F38F